MQETAARNKRRVRGGVIAGLIILVLIIVGTSSFVVIESGTVGVVSVFGAIKDAPLEKGLHFITPFITKVTKVDIKTQKVEAAPAAASRDLQMISSTIVVNYYVNDLSAPRLVSTVGLDYENKIIVPAIQEAVKAVAAQYSAEELITKRQLVSDGIKEQLKEKIGSYGLVIEIFNITNLEFSEAFNAAIEAKQTAQQAALKAQQDLNRIKIEAEQKVVNAQAQADATKAQAEAEAYAIEIIQKQLAQAEAYLEYQKIEKWDGKLPMVQGDSSPIIDMRDADTAYTTAPTP